MAAVACRGWPTRSAGNSRRDDGPRSARRWGSLATGASFWRSAVFAEVYSLAAVMTALTIALLLAWGCAAANRPAALAGVRLSFAAGLGNHLTIVGLVPAFAIYVLTRGRRIWSVWLIAGGALLLAIGLGQYALIVVRTHQGAPYLEVRAERAADLIGVVTAERYADQRFAFGPRVVFTDHLPVLTALIGAQLAQLGAALCLVRAAASVKCRNPALVLGAAAGMFVMILNLSGDLKGFITPLVALLWPLAAVGIDRVAGAAVYSPRRSGGGVARCAGRRHPAPGEKPRGELCVRRSERTVRAGRFLRGVFSQLPAGLGFVAEDDWADMAWTYYTVTGEAGPDGALRASASTPPACAARAESGHRVFAFATAATFLSGEGLQFRHATIAGPPLARWLASLPRGSVLVGATAHASFPANPAVIGHAGLHPNGPARAFEVFAAVSGRRGGAWRAADEDVSLSVSPASLSAALPAFAGALTATAGAGGAAIDLAGLNHRARRAGSDPRGVRARRHVCPRPGMASG